MLDLSDWPLVRLSYPEEVDDAAVAKLDEAMKSVLARGQRFAMVIDGSRTLSLSARHRKMIVDSIGENSEGLKRHCAGQAVVISGALARGVLVAMSWLRPPPAPMRVFENFEEAEGWVRQQLA